MNLYELTVNQALPEFCDARNPDLGEWVEKIDPLLNALGESIIGRDKIEDIELYKDVLLIKTSYSSRGCAMTNYMGVPVSVLKVEDPIQCATQVRLLAELEDIKNKLVTAQNSVVYCSEKISAIKKQLIEED